ncbi:MAG: molybdenum cofactor biosynthesis protein MoaE [Candidatus Bathyarchaeota archaeon]|jgi:molybdopterin synthase catalytic subunit
MIKVQREDIDIQKSLELVRTPDSGGIVTFLGTVRDNAKGRRIAKMSIEVYEAMAVRQLEAIRSEALDKYGVNEIVVIHRYGELNVLDNIVFIAVSAGHRHEAFKACMYVIDELKQRVPIWKKETTPEGDFWVEGEKHE